MEKVCWLVWCLPPTGPQPALEGDISFTLSPGALNWLFWALSVRSGARRLGDFNRDLVPFGDITEAGPSQRKALFTGRSAFQGIYSKRLYLF